MKEPLKIPFLLLFAFLLTTAVLAVLDALAVWGLYESSIHAFSVGWVLQRLPRSAMEVLIPSAIVSIVIVGLRMARHPFSRFLGLLICLVVSYLALVNGMIWLRGLSAKAQPLAETPRQYIQPLSFVEVGGRMVAAGSMEGDTLRGVLVCDPNGKQERFTVYPQATVSASAGALAIIPRGGPAQGGRGAKAVTLAGTPDKSGDALFAADRFTSFFLRDIRTVSADYQKLLARSLGEFFAACFALLFLACASLALLRLTRWPLANILLLFLALRGYFFLYHALSTSLAPMVSKLVTDATIARLFPSVAMGALGVLILLIDILFIPADRWKRMEAA